MSVECNSRNLKSRAIAEIYKGSFQEAGQLPLDIERLALLDNELRPLLNWRNAEAHSINTVELRSDSQTAYDREVRIPFT